MLNLVSIDGNQEVHRNRWHLEFTQFEGDLDDVDRVFAHADDHARAALDSISFRGLERLDAIGVRVGRSDCVVAAFAGVQVVVHPVEAGFLQDLRVLVAHQPGGETDLDRPTRLDFFHEGTDPLRAIDRRSATGEHHAVTRRPVLYGRFGLGENRFIALHRVFANRGVGVLVLRAVAAILGAESVLHVIQNVDHDFSPEGASARFVGGLKKRKQLDVFAVENPECLGLAGRDAVQRVASQFPIALEGVGVGK